MKMSFSFKLKSHPDKLLKEHLQEVAETAVNIYREGNINFKNTNIDYERLIKILCLSHDLGKATKFFQKFRLYDKSLHNELLGHHAALSSLFTYAIAEKFLENQNIEQDYKKLLPFILFQIVRRHHTNLRNFEDEFPVNRASFSIDLIKEQLGSIHEFCSEEFKEIINFIAIEIGVNLDYAELFKKSEDINYFWNKSYVLDGFISQNFEEGILEFYFEFSYLYGILLYSDKMSLADEKREFIENFYDYKSNLFREYKETLCKNKSINQSQLELNELRNKAFREAHETLLRNQDEDMFILSLPTGLGKTIISLSLAHEIIKNIQTKSKIIYCLPFISIIDQVSSDIKYKILPEHFKRKGLKCINEHHHLVSYSDASIEKENLFPNTKMFIECWSSEIIITTFEQILYSLLNIQNMRNMKIAKLQNSVIILDEVQALPLEYYGLISQLILLLIAKFNCKIIIATATYPFIIDGDYVKLLDNKKYFEKLNRTKLINNTDKEIPIVDFVNEIIQISKSSSNTLIVCNTISESKLVLEKLLENDNTKEFNIFYLSTHLIPKERKKRIEKIKLFAKEGKKMMVISTQLIEAGVDLDFDTVIRDFAPFDSIIQAGGRCNRNNRMAQGKIIIYKVVEDNKGTYARKIYSSINLSITECILSGLKEISENQFYSLIDQYYSEIKRKRDSQSKGEDVINLLKEWKLKDAVGKFELIKQQDKREIFVIFDDNSREIFEYFKFNRENKLFLENKKVRSSMNEYIIEVYSKHVSEALLQKIIEDEELFYIEKLKSKDKNFYQYDDTDECGVGFFCNAD